jgi:hypothetical protein
MNMSPATARAEQESTFSLGDTVRETMRAAEYQEEVVYRRLLRMAQTRGDVRDALIALGIRQVIRDFRHAGRPVVVQEEPDGPKRSSGGVAHVGPEALFARVEQRLFWDRYTLYGGKPIREATRDDLLISIEARTLQAKGNIVRADFEKSIARRLASEGNKIVGTVLTNEVVNEIAKKHKIE